jgi:hypothetical protein
MVTGVRAGIPVRSKSRATSASGSPARIALPMPVQCSGIDMPTRETIR